MANCPMCAWANGTMTLGQVMTLTDVEESLPRPIGLRFHHGQKACMVKHGHDPNSTIVKPGATTAVPPHSGPQLRAQCGHGPHENLASKLAHCFPGNVSWDDAALISQGEAPVYVSGASKTTGITTRLTSMSLSHPTIISYMALDKWLRIWEDIACNRCNSTQTAHINTAVSICLDVDLHPTVKWTTNRQPFYTVLSFSDYAMAAWRGHHNGICHSGIEAMYNPPADNHHGHCAAWSVVIHRPLGSVDVVRPRWFIH